MIAGVLLFGREGFTSGATGIGILVGVVFGFYIAFLILASLVSSVFKSIREAEGPLHAGLLAVGFGIFAIATPLLVYVGYLGFYGDTSPFDTAKNSPLGTAWKWFFAIAVGVLILFLVSRIAVWLKEPGNSAKAEKWTAGALFGPIVFPIRKWNFHRDQGSGIAASVLASAYAVLIGMVFSALVIGLIIAFTAGVLLILNVVGLVK